MRASRFGWISRWAFGSKVLGLGLGVFLAGGLVACGGGDERRVCVNTTECAENESCEAGVCQPACTPGVDCPEKDVSVEDGTSDIGDSESDGTNDDGTSASDASDAESDAADGVDAGPDGDSVDELGCELDRSLSILSEGRAFEVRFDDRSTGVLNLPEGWVVDPICCGAGCCQ
jgi:hypothetical protein